MIVIRHKYTDAAREIKRLNPDVILLAANDYIVSDKDKFPDDWYLKCDRSEWGNNSHCTDDGKLYAGREDYPLLNITPESPRVDNGFGQQKFNQFLASYLVKKTDYNYFDGTFFDYWAKKVWGNKVNYADINNDFVADGGSYVNKKWAEGNRDLIQNLRSLIDKPVIAHESDHDYLNGNGFEFWPKKDKKKALLKLFELQQKSEKPVINFAEGYGYENGPDFGPNWRVDFTSSQIGGAYFGHDEGTVAHRFTFLHDEYEADLGHPLQGSAGDPQEITSDVWVRYFEKGAIISNVSGNSYQVGTNQLDGRQYWRFLGGQDPQFNNGQQFTNVNLVGYDGIMLLTEPDTLITPIVIDNVPANMTSLGQKPVIYSGNWDQIKWGYSTKRGKKAYGVGVTWGSEGFLYAISSNSAEAKYEPKINVAGEYEIFEWHPDVVGDGQGSPCNNVKLSITSADGTTEKTVDQSRNYGKWNSLGVFNFNVGSSGRVVLKAPGGCTAASDAIQFVSYDPNSQVADIHPPDRPRGVKVESN